VAGEIPKINEETGRAHRQMGTNLGIGGEGIIMHGSYIIRILICNNYKKQITYFFSNNYKKIFL
jgi:hypothetical protein